MVKKTIDDLAIFSGPRLFERPRPIGQLDVPPVEDYLELLRIPYDARNLTNNGTLVKLLEERLCDYHEVRNCIAVANAALGLTMLAQIFANRKVGEVIMPAFSYRGLPHFVQWAGQIPRFCDVDSVTHGLDPDCLEAAINECTTSILGVCNYNSPGLIEKLCEVGERFNLPVFLDSVYALGCSYKGRMLGRFGRAEVYSTHATKLLNGFEGGYITTNDDTLAEMLRWQRNFALPGLKPEGLDDGLYVLGMNAKLNEMHAAMALLGLDRLDLIINQNSLRYAAYRKILDGISGLKLVSCGDENGEKRNYQMILAEFDDRWPLSRDQTMEILRAEGCAIGPYYSPALHKSEHCPPGLGDMHFPVSEALANRLLQLPVGELVSIDDINLLGELLHFLVNHGEATAARLSRTREAL